LHTIIRAAAAAVDSQQQLLLEEDSCHMQRCCGCTITFKWALSCPA